MIPRLISSLLLLAPSVAGQFFFECDLCRSPDRYITIPNKVVDTGGDIFTCQELDDFAVNGEFGPQSCAIAQQWAAQECGCAGAPITPPPIISVDSCLFCTYPERIVGLPDKWVDTSLGPWNCGELYEAGLNGFLPPQICNNLKREASQACGCRDPVPSPAPSESSAPTVFGQQLLEDIELVPPPLVVPTAPAPTPAPTRAPTTPPTRSPTTEQPIFAANPPGSTGVAAPPVTDSITSKGCVSASPGRGGAAGGQKGC